MLAIIDQYKEKLSLAATHEQRLEDEYAKVSVLQEGEERYTWRNRNKYVEEWKNGAISDNGVLVRKNGNRYEGCWENGVSKGRGVFTWRDGSTSFGNWGKKFVNEKRVSMDECNNNNNKSVSFPIICIWELNGEAGDITCDIVEASMIYDGGRVC